jgi:hypothetical protein
MRAIAGEGRHHAISGSLLRWKALETEIGIDPRRPSAFHACPRYLPSRNSTYIRFSDLKFCIDMGHSQE